MKTISIKLQGVGEKNLTASIVNVDHSIGLRNSKIKAREGVSSIALTEGVFSIVLRCAVFPPQLINIKDSNENLFTITVEKDRANGQPKTTMSRAGNISGELYRQCAGGGNSFILAIGDENIPISVVQSKLPYGSMQAFVPAF